MGCISGTQTSDDVNTMNNKKSNDVGIINETQSLLSDNEFGFTNKSRKNQFNITLVDEDKQNDVSSVLFTPSQTHTTSKIIIPSVHFQINSETNNTPKHPLKPISDTNIHYNNNFNYFNLNNNNSNNSNTNYMNNIINSSNSCIDTNEDSGTLTVDIINNSYVKYKPKIIVIYHSIWDHVRIMALNIGKGIELQGGIVQYYQIEETINENIVKNTLKGIPQSKYANQHPILKYGLINEIYKKKIFKS